MVMKCRRMPKLLRPTYFKSSDGVERRSQRRLLHKQWQKKKNPSCSARRIQLERRQGNVGRKLPWGQLLMHPERIICGLINTYVHTPQGWTQVVKELGGNRKPLQRWIRLRSLLTSCNYKLQKLSFNLTEATIETTCHMKKSPEKPKSWLLILN